MIQYRRLACLSETGSQGIGEFSVSAAAVSQCLKLASWRIYPKPTDRNPMNVTALEQLVLFLRLRGWARQSQAPECDSLRGQGEFSDWDPVFSDQSNPEEKYKALAKLQSGSTDASLKSAASLVASYKYFSSLLGHPLFMYLEGKPPVALGSRLWHSVSPLEVAKGVGTVQYIDKVQTCEIDWEGAFGVFSKPEDDLKSSLWDIVLADAQFLIFQEGTRYFSCFRPTVESELWLRMSGSEIRTVSIQDIRSFGTPRFIYPQYCVVIKE